VILTENQGKDFTIQIKSNQISLSPLICIYIFLLTLFIVLMW